MTVLPGLFQKRIKEADLIAHLAKATNDNAWTLVAIPVDVAFPGPGANDTTSTLGSRKDTKPH